MINQTLNNRYHVTALLGKGAMGAVYRATDTQTGQDVAVKVITQDLAFDQEMLERFRREGEALRRLRHPNIVGFVDMLQFEGHQAIVMEYVPGGNLHALIKKGPLPLDRVHQMALDLCDALTRAHRLNIIHRDIKPENVLIAEDGTPKLTDFGVARLLGETARITSTGALVGTPFYMSPEAWQGKALDEQTDIWSLGVVLYEMVSGRVPFAGETLPAVMNKVLTEPLPDLKTSRPDVPPALAKIIQRMLTRDRTNRYASMLEVALDLERVIKGSSAIQPARETTSQEKGLRPAAKPRLPAWAVGALVTLGALVVVGLLAVGSLAVWTLASKTNAPATAPAAIQLLPTATTAPAPTAALAPTEPAPSQTTVVAATPTTIATQTPAPTDTPRPTPTVTPLPTLVPDITPVSAFIPGAEVTYQAIFTNDRMYMTDWGGSGTTNVTNGHLVIEGKGGIISIANHSTAVTNGYGILVLFRCSSGASGAIMLQDQAANSNNGIGFYLSPGQRFSVNSINGGVWQGPPLSGNLVFAANHWYYALIEIREGGQFYLKMWDKDNSNLYAERAMSMGTQWDNQSWSGTIWTHKGGNGEIEIASYQEFQFSGK